MTSEDVVRKLKCMECKANVEGMARYGINPLNNLGVTMAEIRKLKKEIGKDHTLALELWETGIRDARLLAGMIDEPKEVTEQQMENWVRDFNSWDVCDGICIHLFRDTSRADRKAMEWANREEEYIKRAGFVLMATLTVKNRQAGAETYQKWYPLIKKYASDERNYVKKAVNWALRQIGKQGSPLLEEAMEIAEELEKSGSKAARWVAKDALRELRRVKENG